MFTVCVNAFVEMKKLSAENAKRKTHIYYNNQILSDIFMTLTHPFEIDKRLKSLFALCLHLILRSHYNNPSSAELWYGEAGADSDYRNAHTCEPWKIFC